MATISLKHVSDYTRLNFKELDELTYAEYKVYLIEAWIYNQMQSEEGIEFLVRLKELQETTADMEAVRGVATIQ